MLPFLTLPTFAKAQERAQAPERANERIRVGRHWMQDRSDESWKTSPEVPSILVKAIWEQESGRYVGRLSREFLLGAGNVKHEEIIYRDGKRTRVEFPSGSKLSGQVIVETDEYRRWYKPDENALYILPPRREGLTNLARRAAEKRVTLTVEPGERIAGITTQELVVHDRFNVVTQRLFIDPNSGVVLKRTVFDSLGAQNGYFQFSQINLNPNPFSASLFQLNKPGARVVTAADLLRKTASAQGFDPVIFPASTGFRFEDSRITTLRNEKVLVESFRSDRGHVTLFELKNAISPERLKKMSRGETQVYSWERNGKWFVLIGPKTEQQFAERAQTLYTGTP